MYKRFLQLDVESHNKKINGDKLDLNFMVFITKSSLVENETKNKCLSQVYPEEDYTMAHFSSSKRPVNCHNSYLESQLLRKPL